MTSPRVAVTSPAAELRVAGVADADRVLGGRDLGGLQRALVAEYVAAVATVMLHSKHACLQPPPTSATNATLLAFAAEDRAAALRLLLGEHCTPPSIDLSRPPGAQQQTPARRGCGARRDRPTDRRTDTVPLHRPCRIHTYTPV